MADKLVSMASQLTAIINVCKHLQSVVPPLAELTADVQTARAHGCDFSDHFESRLVRAKCAGLLQFNDYQALAGVFLADSTDVQNLNRVGMDASDVKALSSIVIERCLQKLLRAIPAGLSGLEHPSVVNIKSLATVFSLPRNKADETADQQLLVETFVQQQMGLLFCVLSPTTSVPSAVRNALEHFQAATQDDSRTDNLIVKTVALSVQGRLITAKAAEYLEKNATSTTLVDPALAMPQALKVRAHACQD